MTTSLYVDIIRDCLQQPNTPLPYDMFRYFVAINDSIYVIQFQLRDWYLVRHSTGEVIQTGFQNVCQAREWAVMYV